MDDEDRPRVESAVPLRSSPVAPYVRTVAVPARKGPPLDLPIGVVRAPIELALGTAATVGTPVVAAVRSVAALVDSTVRPVAEPVTDLVLHPPLVPEQYTPGGILRRLRERGREVTGVLSYDTQRVGGAALDQVVPVTTDALVDRIDLGRIVEAALDQLDLTELVLARVDLDRIVVAVLDGLDLTAVVVDRVDLGQVVEVALDGLDLTELVLARVDLDRIVLTALDGLDLTEVVMERVDLGRVVEAALDRLDLTELVRERVDVAGLAEQVINEINLPEIIRSSTTGVATDALRGARLTSIGADEKVAGIVDRVLLRRRPRRTDAPGDVELQAADADAQGGDANAR